MSILKTLKTLASVLRVYQNLTFEDAVRELDELVYPSAPNATQTELMLSTIVTQLRAKLNSLPRVDNPLLLLLEDTLEKKFESSSESKAIVFVETRSEAASLQRWIASRDKLKAIRSDVVTGQTGESGRKMTKVEQNQSLDAFREEDSNLLVSTSVLEEGLDVPACNLIITYQKVTSEIAQVQGKGRARAQHSQSLSIVASDSGKHYQEMLNQQKILLVEQASEMLPEGEGLRIRLKEKQDDILKRSEQKKAQSAARNHRYSPEEVDIHCNNCSAFLCNGSDIHTIPTTLNHVVSNDEFLSEVLIKDHPRPVLQSEGLSRTNKVFCKHCETNAVGIIGRWWKDQVQYPVLKCKYIQFKANGVIIPCRQWKKCPFAITPLH